MNDRQLLERLAATDAYRAEIPVPEEIWSAAGLLQEVERRVNLESVTPYRRTVAVRKARRPVAVAATAFVSIVILVLAAVLWNSSRNDLPDVTDDVALTPLEVGNALNLAIATGDFAAARSLYADDATYTHEPGRTSSSIRHGAISGSFHPGIPVEKPLGRVESFLESSLGLPFNRFDWDGDGAATGFDDLAADLMALYAQGVSRAFSCTQPDSVTLVCENVLEGHTLLSEPPPVRDIFTVVDGLITHQEYNTEDVVLGVVSIAEQLQYLSYVEANQPALEDQLFEGSTRLIITPDTVETHRRLIEEWSSQR